MKIRIIYKGKEKDTVKYCLLFQSLIKDIYKEFCIPLSYCCIDLSIRPVPISRIKYEIIAKCGESWELTWDIENE